MLNAISQGFAVASGIWIASIGVYMLVRPHHALAVLGRMGSSPSLHVGEMVVRIIAGIALMIAATGSRFPLTITIVGAFLIVTALVLLALPRRWHAAYSTWWSRRIPVAAVRLIGPLSWIIGGILAWSVL